MSSSSSAGRRRARGCVAGEKDDRSVCMDGCGDGRSAPLLLPVLSERCVRSPPVWDSDRGRCTTLTPQRNVESVMNLLVRLERKSAGEFVPVRVANEQVCARRTTGRTLPRRPPYASLLCGLRPHRCLPANIVGGGCCETVWRTKNLRHTSYDATIGGPPAPKGFHLSQEIWKNREPSRTDLLPRIPRSDESFRIRERFATGTRYELFDFCISRRSYQKREKLLRCACSASSVQQGVHGRNLTSTLRPSSVNRAG